MSAYPPGTVFVKQYAKLQGHSGVFNSKSPEVRAIRNSLKGQTSKLPVKLLSMAKLHLGVDKKIIEEEEDNMEDDNIDTMSIADSSATSNKNTRKNANKKLRKAKLKAAGGDGVPTDARSPAAHAASSSGRSCYHNDDDAASICSWQKVDAVSSSARSESVASSQDATWDVISNADMLSDASARKRRKAGRASVSSAVAEAAQAVTASATALSALSKPQSGDAHKSAADNNSDFPGNFAMIFTVIALTAAFLYIWRKRYNASFQACADVADTMYIWSSAILAEVRSGSASLGHAAYALVFDHMGLQVETVPLRVLDPLSVPSIVTRACDNAETASMGSSDMI